MLEFLVQFEGVKAPIYVKIGTTDEYIGPKYGFRVVTTCEMWKNGYHLATGKAVLNIRDEYNPSTGNRLAAKRALDNVYITSPDYKSAWRLLRIVISNTPPVSSDKIRFWWIDKDNVINTKERLRYPYPAIPF